MHASLQAFIDDHVARLAPLEREANRASWMANTTGESRYEEEAGRLTAQIRRLHAEREPFLYLRGLKDGNGVADPVLARQLTLLLNAYRANQIEPARIERMVQLEKLLESRFNNFRALFQGQRVTDNHIREVLAEGEDPRVRRQAWEASKQIGAEVCQDLLRLVGWRNEAARQIGFPNYYTMMIALDELDEEILFATLGKLERSTREPFRRYKRDLDRDLARRFGCAHEALRPWHYGDPFFQEAPRTEVQVDHLFAGADLVAVARRFFGALGFDIEPVLARSDLCERPGKCQHAFCTDMDREGDVRILCNLRANEFWMGTLLHELGHAVYDRCVDRKLPYLLRSHSHILCTEAAARLMGRLSKRGAWIARYLDVPAEEALAAEARLARVLRGQLLVQTRWCLVVSHFERALYRDPAQDLVALWWGLVEQFQEVRRPDGRRAPDWAAKLHLSVAPVYCHNYLLGEMMASQLESYLVEKVVGGGPGAWPRYVASAEAGAFLRQHFFAPDRTRDWAGTLEHATGSRLDPAFFAAGLSVAADG